MLGHKIHKLRKENGLSLEALAAKTSSSKSYLWEIEKGRVLPSSKKLVCISKALYTTVDFLTDDSRKEMSISDQENNFLIRYRALTEQEKIKLSLLLNILFNK